MTVLGQIQQLSKQLYPTGRAFKIPFSSFFEKMIYGLSISEAQAYNDALSILDSAIPDNNNFDLEDATAWERRLGLITNTLVSLDTRKLAIKRKMNHPGNIKARQHYLLLERELQAAGFDVYVYENRFDDGMGGLETKSPSEVSLSAASAVQHGDFQHGDNQHGVFFSNVIVNSIFSNVDSAFDIGDTLNFTFFIGGNPIGSYANVDANREKEFRQLILKTKPTHTVGYLFINYI